MEAGGLLFGRSRLQPAIHLAPLRNYRELGARTYKDRTSRKMEGFEWNGRKTSGMNRGCQTTRESFDLAQGTRRRAMQIWQNIIKESSMTSSEHIVILLVWILLIPGLFFTIRKAWRRHKARRQETEKD
jgi:hypothetical protein